MRALLLRVARKTVWHPGAIPALERKYAMPLKWFVFPAFDIAMVIMGVRGITGGIPSLEALFPGNVSFALYVVWVLVAALCFLGAAVPRLWVLEIGGKVSLFALLAVYLIALRVAEANNPDGSRDAITVFVCVAMLFPLLRLWILGIEERDRKET